MLRLLLAASQVLSWTATATLARPQFDGAHVIRLSGRQLPPDDNLPPQCTNDCPPTIISILGSNTCTINTCCSPAFAMGFFNCAKCVGQASGTSNFTQIQGILDTLHNQCAGVGISIPVLTFPGQAKNRPGLSSVVSASTRPTSSGSSRPSGSANVSSSATPTVSAPAISQITITSLAPTSTTPTVTQSTVTGPPATSAPASGGTHAIGVPFFRPWAMASIAGIPLLGMLYLGV